MSVRTHMREREYPGDLASPEHGGACSGAAGALPQETREGKKPHQAPPLPPAETATTAQTHSRE